MRQISAMSISSPRGSGARTLHTRRAGPRRTELTTLIDPETGREIEPMSDAQARRHMAFAALYYAAFVLLLLFALAQG